MTTKIGVRGLLRSWSRQALKKATDFASERLEEVRAELEDEEDLLSPDLDFSESSFLDEPPIPLDTDNETPPPDCVAVDLVDASGDLLIVLRGTRHPVGDEQTVELSLPENLPFEFPAAVRVAGFRIRSLRRLTGTTTGLVKDLCFKEGPSLLLHEGFERMEAYRKIRALISYPDTLLEDRSDVRLRVAATGEGSLLFTATLYLKLV